MEIGVWRGQLRLLGDERVHFELVSMSLFCSLRVFHRDMHGLATLIARLMGYITSSMLLRLWFHVRVRLWLLLGSAASEIFFLFLFLFGRLNSPRRQNQCFSHSRVFSRRNVNMEG